VLSKITWPTKGVLGEGVCDGLGVVCATPNTAQQGQESHRTTRWSPAHRTARSLRLLNKLGGSPVATTRDRSLVTNQLFL